MRQNEEGQRLLCFTERNTRAGQIPAHLVTLYHLGASSADDHASIHHRRQGQASIFVPIKAATDQFAANILPMVRP
jgi:hypothetical protein